MYVFNDVGNFLVFSISDRKKKRLKTTSKFFLTRQQTMSYKLNNYAVKLLQSKRQQAREMFVKLSLMKLF